jgi:hypothetical protein
MTLRVITQRYDTQYEDIQYKDIQDNNKMNETLTITNGNAVMLIVTNKLIMLSVTMLDVVMVSVVAPIPGPFV